jgi:alpha-amylase
MSSPLQPERKVVLYFQVHQPRRLNALNFFDIGLSGNYFNDDLNAQILRRVAKQCYLPTNAVLLKILKNYPQLKITFSVSGVTLDQMEEFTPEVIESFRSLIETGSVEFLSETYYHSLAGLMQGDEFEAQVVKHSEKILELFHVRPHVFRNTELMYDNELGKRISMLGYDGVLTEGTDSMQKQSSINSLFHHPDLSNLKIMLRNYRLSDDIAFRFRDFNLTADKFLSWMKAVPKKDELITLGMDYETFGEHHKPESGIQKFLEQLLTGFGKQSEFQLITPTEAIRTMNSKGPLSVPETISWADQERDLSAWLGNDMQRDSFYTVSRMEQSIKNFADPSILKQWRSLLTSDHFYYMSTKKNADGSIHSYFSPFPSPYEAFINYMNVIADFSIHTKNLQEASLEKASALAEHERQKQNETVPTWAMNVDQDHYTPYRH